MFRSFRFPLAVLAVTTFASFAFSQNLPAYRWGKQVDGSGVDSFAGLGVDAVGNTYIAGSTYSPNFPVKAAVQTQLASAGLYRIDGPGSAYVELGPISAQFVVIDPLNSSTLYVGSNGTILRSMDGGATLSPLTLPSSNVSALAINPVNDQILYGGTSDQGILKSTDGGATWAAANGGLSTFEFWNWIGGIWIDPTMPNVLFATGAATSYCFRSADGGASWQLLSLPSTPHPPYAAVRSVSFDTANPGVLYVVGPGTLKSTDHGGTFTLITTLPFEGVLPDPNHSGRLVASGVEGIFESGDGGSTWTMKFGLTSYDTIAPDWANGYLYAASTAAVLRMTTDLQTITPIGPPAGDRVREIAIANGHVYVAKDGARDVYVTKLDPNGNVVYSTYFGGSGDDVAVAIAVDQAGNVYVTGTTDSVDFPVTTGAYATAGSSFLFKLNADGSVGYSTYFAPSTSQTVPAAVAVDAAGSAYLAGSSLGGLPVTPGAYLTTCTCGVQSVGPIANYTEAGFVTKFDPTGSSLIYSTYVGAVSSGSPFSAVDAMALAQDGTVYVGGLAGINRLNATGSALLGSLPGIISPTVMAVGPDGSFYVAGVASTGNPPFQTTPGAFEPTPRMPFPTALPLTAIVKIDAQLSGITSATYFGAPFDQIGVLTLDAAGNLYAGGSTGQQGLPTRTPLQGGFFSNTGFLSELSGDLSTLIFSSYFGDNEQFAVQGVGLDPNGTIRFGGATGSLGSYGSGGGPANVYVNSLSLAPPPALRIDSVVNAASLLDGPISVGETIVVQGAGFGSDAQLLIGGVVVPAVSLTSTSITAAVPQSVALGAAEVQVQSSGTRSNQVLMSVTGASPAIFSQDGSGYGQAYILNKDGTLNMSSNPAAPGDQITIFATGVGPVSVTQGNAVTQFPVTVFIEGNAATNVAAAFGPVDGLPGNVYQITVTVPSAAPGTAYNPYFNMLVDGVFSQNEITISVIRP